MCSILRRRTRFATSSLPKSCPCSLPGSHSHPPTIRSLTTVVVPSCNFRLRVTSGVKRAQYFVLLTMLLERNINSGCLASDVRRIIVHGGKGKQLSRLSRGLQTVCLHKRLQIITSKFKFESGLGAILPNFYHT